MGFYDTIYCDYPLPDADVDTQEYAFRTRDLGEGGETYRISQEGHLYHIKDSDQDGEEETEILVDFHGILSTAVSLYQCIHEPPVIIVIEDDGDEEYTLYQLLSIRYAATFTHGKIEHIESVYNNHSWVFQTDAGEFFSTSSVKDEDITRLLEIELQKPDNRRIVIPETEKEEEEEFITTSHISDIPTETLNAIKKLRYDRILEKHEGPWTWESALKYDNACIVQFKNKNQTFVEFTVLMPFPEHHKAQIKTVFCADAEHEGVKTIFFTCPSLAGYDETETNLQWCGFCAVCREISIPGTDWLENAAPFYVTVLLHETFLIEPEMSDETIFRKVL
jgi:hypothetical protein